MKANWGFNICDNYDINLTCYGNGGSYNWNDFKILIRYKDKPKEPYFYTIFHEAVHIGIEENIVQKYKLSQAEKEIIVDVICKNYLPNDYLVQKFKNVNRLCEILEEIIV